MRIITAVGYYATGSGVIQDLCREFSNVEMLSDYEIRFLQDPDGISDLQYNLVENNHRHNTGFAVKRFLKYMNFLNGSVYTRRYQKIFGSDFWKVTEEYVESLTALKAKTWWHGDQLAKGRLFYFLDILYGKLTTKFCSNDGAMSLLQGHEENFYTYLSLEEFLEHTKNYTKNLFELAKKTNTPFMFVNQLVSPSNVNRYINYFNDIKVVAVERDPRDLYIAAKEIYRADIIPVTKVEEFCIWYKVTRAHREHDNYDHERVLYVNFEDLIYNYDSTTKMVIDFLDLDEREHIEKRKYFDPKKSIRGTKLIQRFPKYLSDVKYIEEHLNNYIYDYVKNVP